MKNISIKSCLIILFLSLIFSGCGGGGSSSDSAESDQPATSDPFSSATLIDANTSKSSNLPPGTERDYYKFNLNTATTFQLSAISKTTIPENIHCRLYNSAKSEVEYDAGNSGHCGFTKCLNAGYWYISFNATLGPHGPYSFVAKTLGDCGGSGEEGTEGTESTEGTEGADPGGTGDISFSIVWNWSGSDSAEGPDIDIWVRDPNGHTLSTSRDGYGLGPCPDGGKIDYDDQGGTGPGDGGGPERVFWPTGNAPSGTYSYGVRYYEGSGTANYTLRRYKNGSLDSTHTGTLGSPSSNVTIGSTTYGPNGTACVYYLIPGWTYSDGTNNACKNKENWSDCDDYCIETNYVNCTFNSTQTCEQLGIPNR